MDVASLTYEKLLVSMFWAFFMTFRFALWCQWQEDVRGWIRLRARSRTGLGITSVFL